MMNEATFLREKAFYDSLTVNSQTKRHYSSGLNSTFLHDYIKKEYKVNSVFEITDLSLLWDIYSYINLHPKNVLHHRCYSAPIMRYIRFLNDGKKYGKRIDAKK